MHKFCQKACGICTPSNSGSPPEDPNAPPADDGKCDNKYGCRKNPSCCNDGFRCFEKDDVWSQCLTTCEPGVHYDDPWKYRTPWTCKPIDQPEEEPEKQGGGGWFWRSADMAADVGCVDEDEACAKWASKGECEKNPAFMTLFCKSSCEVCNVVFEDEITARIEAGGAELDLLMKQLKDEKLGVPSPTGQMKYLKAPVEARSGGGGSSYDVKHEGDDELALVNGASGARASDRLVISAVLVGLLSYLVHSR